MMRKLLDILFGNQKLSMGVPLFWAVFMYGLYICFGNAPDKVSTMIMIPVMSLLVFFAMYFILAIVARSLSAPAWFLNLCFLVMALVFGFGTLYSGVHFIIHLRDGFTPIACLAPVVWSALAFAHSKRGGDRS